MANGKPKVTWLNPGTGMVLGGLAGGAVALGFNLWSGNSLAWSVAIPLGLIMGLALGAIGQGRERFNKEDE